MPKKNYCPVANIDCVQKKCQWWVDEAERCAVALIPRGLQEIVNIIDAK